MFRTTGILNDEVKHDPLKRNQPWDKFCTPQAGQARSRKGAKVAKTQREIHKVSKFKLLAVFLCVLATLAPLRERGSQSRYGKLR